MEPLHPLTPRLIPVFPLVLLLGSLFPQNQPASLAEAEKTFRDQVLKDDTISDKRLFLRRYELVLKLLKKDRWADASKELGEIRDDFAGRSAAFLDYLRARLEMKRGDLLNTNASLSWEWSVTNVTPRGDQRYVWFPEKGPDGSSNVAVERRVMTYPLEAKPHYDLSGELLSRLTMNANPLLREASSLALGDLAWSQGDRERAGELWGNFSRKFPASALRLDAWLRLSRLAVEKGAWGEAAENLRLVQREFPKAPAAGIAEEKIRLLVGFTNATSPSPEIQVILEGFRRELALRADLILILDQLAARGLAEP
jgi:tetratricopeptide (TPR) repeat protein